MPLEEIAARVCKTPEEVQSWIDENRRRGETHLERPQTDPVRRPETAWNPWQGALVGAEVTSGRRVEAAILSIRA